MILDISEKIRVLRLSHHLTQEDMAEKLNLSTSGYAKIERGESELHLNRLEQIAKIFNLSAIDLLTLNQEKIPKNQVISFNDNANNNKHNYFCVNDGQSQSPESYQILSHEIEKLKLIVESQGKEIELLKTLLNIQRLNINA